MDPQNDYSGLGFAFFTMGVGLTISLGLMLDVVFLGTGVPFIVLGIVFLLKGKGDGGKAEKPE